MKMTKIAAIVAAAALLVIGAAFTSMAATYNWQIENGQWVCYDENDMQYQAEWCKSAAGEWYYLDEDGYMATNLMVEYKDTGKNVYLGADGAIVKNQWVKIVDEEDEEETSFWYYFGDNGYAYKNAKKDINGKTYFFNTECKMQYGWVAYDGEAADKCAGSKKYSEANYYCGDAEDGAMKKSEWAYIDITEDAGLDDTTEKWFYFGTTGKKYFAAPGTDLVVKKIGSTYYGFDEEGIMTSGWDQSASDSEASYFSDPEDGARVTSGWFRAYEEGKTPDDVDDATLQWFYATGSGKLAKSTIKKINSKYYAFNADGVMLSGLQWAKKTESGYKFEAAIGDEYEGSDLKADLIKGKDGYVLYYFSGDGETDGSMKVGAQDIDVNGDTVTLTFKKTGVITLTLGTAITETKTSGIYKNGLKLTADSDLKYGFVKAKYDPAKKAIVVDSDGLLESGDYTVYTAYEVMKNYDTVDYICINTAGKLQTKLTNKIDGDGYYFCVKDGQVTYVGEDKE